MFLSRWSVQRPIAMTALIIILVMIGLNFYPKISIDLLPNMEIPTVLVRCEYQGASPTEIEVEIAKRIEDAVSSLDGIRHITSVSIEDEARIQLEFNMGTNVDIAATDIREALNRIRADLPDGADEPTIRKIDTNATTVVQAFLVGDRTQDDLYDYADDVIADRFSSVPGVGEVRVYGANEMQIHVLLKREKLTAMNLSISDVVDKLKENNIREPLGRIQFDKGEKNVTFDGDFKDFEQIKALEIGKFKDKRIYLRDVADVKFMSREVRSKAYVNGEPAARFRIVKKGEANAIEVINGIRDRFNAMIRNGELPTGMKLVWFTDSGAFIQASVDDAWSSILTGIILTAVLLFLFLHEPRSTFIVMISMPISVVVTFAVMAYFNYSFNIMTLLSLGCSVGVLVTNSIVVIENIFKHLDRGEAIKTAAERGTGEVIAAVSASALTNVVVFVPVMMMSTRIGRMMVPFAGVMVGATLVSLFISFTLTPILACVLLKKKKQEELQRKTLLQRMFVPWDIGYDWFCRKFDKSIEWTARYPKTLMLAVLALALGTLAGAVVRPPFRRPARPGPGAVRLPWRRRLRAGPGGPVPARPVVAAAAALLAALRHGPGHPLRCRRFGHGRAARPSHAHAGLLCLHRGLRRGRGPGAGLWRAGPLGHGCGLPYGSGPAALPAAALDAQRGDKGTLMKKYELFQKDATSFRQSGEERQKKLPKNNFFVDRQGAFS